jgi:hypothetical protein
MLRVTLDGNTVVAEPIGVTEISEHLYYSYDLSTYLLEINGTITFIGSEYDYLRNKWLASVCDDAVINIKDLDSPDGIDFTGFIKLSDVVWWPDKKWAVCEIQDDSITSLVVNNRSIECSLSVGKTKNGIAYTVTSQTDIEIFSPTTANSVTSRAGIRIFDALSSIITFVSDGSIGFVSDYFDYNTNSEPHVYSVIMTGLSIRTGGSNEPVISFVDLFGDLNKLHNLAMSFENGNIRIEDKDYFKKDSTTVSFDNVRDLSQELDTNTLYARVKFGSSEDSTQTNYLQDIRFNGTREEEYHLGGQCNIDTYLDLKLSALIPDTNIIQDVLPSAGSMGGTDNADYDDSVFILNLNVANQSQVTAKPGSVTDFYFNDYFSNRNVAIRWFGQIPQTIYNFLGSGNDGCLINQSFNYFPTSSLNGFQPDQSSPLPWNDVNANFSIASSVYFPFVPYDQFDPTGGTLYNQVMDIGIYTAPNNAVYSFEIDVITNSNNWFIAKMISNTLGGGGGGYYLPLGVPIGGGLFRITGGATFYLNAGEYVGARTIGAMGDVYTGSTFRCFDPLGGAWQTYDSSNVFQIKNNFEFPISLSDWKAIKSNPFDRIPVSYLSGSTNVWLQDIERKLTGGAQLEMLGKNG